MVMQSDENDALAITKAEEGQVMVQSASSLAASKNAKLDHQLEEEQGERALLHYTSRACTDWYDKLTLYKSYNIAVIDEDLLVKIVYELDSREVQANLKQVHLSAYRAPYQTNPSIPHPYNLLLL
ncbi:hypothetical protein J3R82DRAFT_10171 [Butyriboletus roseoflavus]|nr:hypothetical protein J3R82DRAFT_10171 [Butyriboletus roseoflavus]